MMINLSKYLIRFFQVGEGCKCGDAILIELYDMNDTPHLVLIDGGYKETGDKIVDYLTRKYNKSIVIEYIFNTHPDKDHISGLIPIIQNENIQIKELILNRPWIDAKIAKDYFRDQRITPNSLLKRMKDSFSLLAELENIANKRNITIVSPRQGRLLYNGVLQILGPSSQTYKKNLLLSDKTPETILSSELNKEYIRKTYTEENYNIETGPIKWFDEEQTSEINQTSIILSFKLNNLHFLFTGDAGKEGINEALDFYESQNNEDGPLMCKTSDFTHLQLPHHGSRKNIDPTILQRIQAKTYIISCSPNGEQEGHPSRRLMNKILEINKSAQIYRTGKSNLIFYQNVKVNAKTATPQTISYRMDGKSL